MQSYFKALTCFSLLISWRTNEVLVFIAYFLASKMFSPTKTITLYFDQLFHTPFHSWKKTNASFAIEFFEIFSITGLKKGNCLGWNCNISTQKKKKFETEEEEVIHQKYFRFEMFKRSFETLSFNWRNLAWKVVFIKFPKSSLISFTNYEL